jgi:type I restriction enzyme, S subunit
MNDRVPLVPLGELLSKSESWVDIRPDQRYRQVTVRLWGKGITLRGVVSGTEIAASRQLLVKPLQFILSRIDARNGAFGLIPDELDGAVVSSDFPVFALNHLRVLPQFLNWMSKTSDFVDLCKASSEGTTNRVRLKEDRFLAAEIPLPPLEEQRRIVARIEELAARIEEARGLRREAMEEVDTLMRQIMSETLNYDQWTKTLLGDLLRENSLNGLPLRPSDTPQGLPILRISAATSRHDAIIDETDCKYIEVNERDVSKYKLESGDLLACRFNGNSHYVGRFALYMGFSNRLQLYPDKLIRFRVDTKKILPEFTRYSMNSPIIRESVEAFCATTAGNIGISATDLKTISIPVPPLPEQRRIVAYLDDLQAKVDALKQLQAETQADLDSLLPSILDKAFKGELV